MGKHHGGVDMSSDLRGNKFIILCVLSLGLSVIGVIRGSYVHQREKVKKFISVPEVPDGRRQA